MLLVARGRQGKSMATLRDELRNRNDGYGYGMFLLLFLGICYLIADAYNLRIATLVFILLVAVLELSYRLSIK